jgi:peptidoglycan hydrolase-like protein with peptidoglycan-binding domain
VIEAVRANREESRYDFATVAGRQQALHDLGYSPGRVDGLWGPRSRGALIRFQQDHGLAADGIWGLATEAALSGALRA